MSDASPIVPEFIKKLREHKLTDEPTQPPGFAQEDIPEAPSQELSDIAVELDNVLADLDILDAYRKFCGKMEPNVGSRRESIMISCPNPSHPDKVPSAWINLDKQVWHCGACDFGGDKFTIAALNYGMPMGSYQQDFFDLKKRMADDLGYTIKKTLSGQNYIDTPIIEVEEEPEVSNVVAIHGNEAYTVPELDAEKLFIDWEQIVPSDTFLYEYMKAATIDDLPHEYHFWCGLLGVAFAAGRSQQIMEAPSVKPNLYVVTYGKTGSGKSRSFNPLMMLLQSVLPYNEDTSVSTTGTKILASPASAESLISQFSRLIDGTDEYESVRGLIKIEEFASFVVRAGRNGNNLKQQLIEMFDAKEGPIDTHGKVSGLSRAMDPFCQVLTSTQPEAIHDFLRRTDIHSGFLNRYIISAGEPRVEPISYGGVTHDLSTASDRLRDVHTWCMTDRLMTLQGAAFDEWDAFYKFRVFPAKISNPMYSRLDLILKKIILNFTINEMRPEPTVDIVERACSLTEYLIEGFRLFAQDLSYNENEECRNHVKLILSQAKRPLGMRELTLQLQEYPMKLVLDTLQQMAKLEEIHEDVSKPKQGRPQVKYSYAE